MTPLPATPLPATPLPATWRPRRTARSLVVLALLALTACGTPHQQLSAPSRGSALPTASPTDSPTATPTASAYPVSIVADNGTIELAARPTRIVSLSASATEMLFAIGADEQVTAVDSQSNFPAGAPLTKLSAFKPNAEAIVGYHPDLVIASNDQEGIVGKLKTLKVPVLLLGAPADLAGAWRQIELIGRATGHAAEAADVVQALRGRMDALVAAKPAGGAPVTVFHELGPELYSATSSTFIGSVYRELGLVNIADPAAKGGNNYPQLTPEAVVKADPDIIVLADTKCCRQTAATVARRSGFSTMSAVRKHEILEVDDDIASRWGPRIVDLAELVAKRARALHATAS